MVRFPVIAIVDDDPDVRGSLDSFLRSASMKPHCFASGEDLLAAKLEGSIACVVTDLHMPGMSGLELMTELTRRGWKTPLIIVTAYPTQAVRDQAREGGASAFLVKPVDPEQLIDAIERAIGPEAPTAQRAPTPKSDG